MGTGEINLIQERYHNNDYYNYPEMQRMIEEVVQNPEKEIVIADNFISKTLEDTGLLLDIVRKVKIFIKKFFHNFQYFFSSNYRDRYDIAVAKIEKAYSDKLGLITQLSSTLKRNREPIEGIKSHVVELKNRIKVLREEKKTVQQKLEEKINAKNLVVAQARILKTKNEHVPTRFEQMGRFFSNLTISLGKKKEEEREASEIQRHDPSFPLENLSEENINAYAEEKVDESPLIQEIKKERVSLEEKQHLIEETEKTLEACNALLTDAIHNISKTTKEICALNLENFFEDEDLVIPLIEEENVEVTTPKELTVQEKRTEAIKESIIDNTGIKDLAVLVTILLKRLPGDAISEYSCDGYGNFTLHLKESYSLWLPEKELDGGVVIILGHKTGGKITGKLERGKIFFHNGMSSYARAPLLGNITATFDGIQYYEKKDIRIGGTYLGQTQWKKKTFSQVKKDWEKESVFISKSYPGGYSQFLEERRRK